MKSCMFDRVPKISGNRGTAMLELAIVLPFLVLMALAVFDYARAIHAKNIITNMSREGANLASRSTLPATQIMDTLSYTAQPLDMNANGVMYISVIQGVQQGGSVVPTIQSQQRWQNRSNPPSKLGTVGNAANGLGSLNLTPGETVYAVEVFYHYQSALSTNAMPLDKQLYSMSVF